VGVDAALRDAGLPGNIADSRAVVAVAQQQLRRGVENAVGPLDRIDGNPAW
jgi:hypothetical protein